MEAPKHGQSRHCQVTFISVVKRVGFSCLSKKYLSIWYYMSPNSVKLIPASCLQLLERLTMTSLLEGQPESEAISFHQMAAGG